MAVRSNARGGATDMLDLAARAGMLDLAPTHPDRAAVTYVKDYTALVTRNADGSVVSHNGVQGRGSFISFSFETKVPDYSLEEYSKKAVDSVKPMTAAQKDLAREALKAWGDASGVTFLEVPEGQGDMKFIRIEMNFIDKKAGGFAVLPSGAYDGQPSTSDVYIDHQSANWLQLYLHEIGHALGLKHPFEGDIQLDESVDNYGSTVMSYTPDSNPKDELGYMDYDAIRFLYGDNSNDGKQVQGWNWNEKTKTLSQYGFDTDETILGIGGNDVIYGNAGNDMIQGREGSDELHGGEGNDTLRGGYGAGHDRLFGDNGDDLVEVTYGTGAKLTIDGGNGTDQITFWFQNKVNFKYDTWAKTNKTINVEKTALSALDGNHADRITGGKLMDTIFGRGGNDVLAGGDGDDSIWGGDGQDKIDGGNGIDRLSGEAGRDTINGGDGNDLIWAGADDDTIRGGNGDDYIEGGEGDDLILGGEGADNIWGGNGVDTVSYAGEKKGVNVTINASREVTKGVFEFLNQIENLTGTSHNDTLTGDAGANVLNGGGGNDRLVGGAGIDRLSGGAGADRFVFAQDDSGATRARADQILDFDRGEKDKIDLSGIDAIAGTSKNDAFTFIGTAAFSKHAGELHLSYKGGISFVEGDTNGDGIADFALLVTGDKLQANDFVL